MKIILLIIQTLFVFHCFAQKEFVIEMKILESYSSGEVIIVSSKELQKSNDSTFIFTYDSLSLNNDLEHIYFFMYDKKNDFSFPFKINSSLILSHYKIDLSFGKGCSFLSFLKRWEVIMFDGLYVRSKKTKKLKGKINIEEVKQLNL